MNERQKKVLSSSFQMLSAAAHRGRRLVEDDSTSPTELLAHVKDINELARAIEQGLSRSIGATVALGQIAIAKDRDG